MTFHDLNLAYSQDHDTLSHALHFARELEYGTVALSLAISGKIPSPCPSIPVADIAKPIGLHVLTRLTITISDTTQNHRLPSLIPSYDIIALRPTNEKALQHCCSSLECDLISIDFSQRLPFILKFKTVAAALQRGTRFEICYAPGIVAGGDARRNLISGSTQLIRATRGRGIVVSSEAKSALGLRGPWDIINLAQVWGLSQQRAKEAVCEETAKVVRLAGIKRTSFRGVVDIIDGGIIAPTSERTAPLHTGGRAKSDLKPRTEDNTLTDTDKPLVEAVNGVKRKASTSPLNPPQAVERADEQPISKREMKRRAKKARLEGKMVSNTVVKDTSNAFPLQHESLVSHKSK